MLPTVGFMMGSSSVSHDGSSLQIPVVLTGTITTGSSPTVDVRVNGGDAMAGTDFTFSDQTLTFDDAGTQNVALMVLPIGVVETSHTVSLRLSNAKGADITTAQHVL